MNYLTPNTNCTLSNLVTPATLFFLKRHTIESISLNETELTNLVKS